MASWLLALALCCVVGSAVAGPPVRYVNGTCLMSKAEFLRTHPNHVSELITSPLPHTYLKENDLPVNWDWRNVNGVNYVTPSVNQHIPQYCGSCWEHGTTSAFADRLKIMRKAQYPEILVSRQVLLNCQECGSCGGGWPDCVYEYLAKSGLPDATCQPYRALNGKCDSMAYCYNCASSGTCSPVTKYPKYYAAQYGGVSGSSKMKAELYARGPLACMIMVTNNFEEYKGGIYSERTGYVSYNHVLSVAGWGKDPTTGVEFWIGRNSWGSYWGEGGWFRIKMGSDNLGIEGECLWAVPKSS